METIKVNMSPNPLDVQTIHASQNDGEARQWEFELHNNGELIDTSDVKEQLVFKAYKGGTEQLLPENGSTPTTSPFKGDIRYPQGLLTDQEFTYRQSPTEEDGLAKITDIKGNTLVWNQLVKNGNFADTSNWSSSSNVSITASNNILQVTNATGRNGDYYSAQNVTMKVGHKYYFHAEAKKTDVSTAQTLLLVYFGEGGNTFAIDALKENTNWISKSTIFTCVSNTYNFVRLRTQVANATNEFRNVMLIDITQMGLDISSPSEFASLFSLPYYAYNQGSLLSFMGNGIKTVGKNLVNPNDFVQGLIDWQSGNVGANPSWITSPFISVLDATSVTVQGWKDGAEENFMVRFTEYDGSYNVVQNTNNINISAVAHYQRKVTLNANTKYIRFSCGFNNRATTPQTFFAVNRVMLEFGGTASSYESYQEDTLSLLISTYFPSGMKSAGSVYDELTESKAVTRIGSVTIDGTQGTFSMPNTNQFNIDGLITDYLHRDSSITYVANRYNAVIQTGSNAVFLQIQGDKKFNFGSGASASTIRFYDTAYTSIDDFKSALANNPVTIFYELETPTETSFTTASLVTENAEIPLSNNDGTLIGKCTEELSAEPGFHDAKIKLTDSDGTCYSNKLQLHVERSPQ